MIAFGLDALILTVLALTVAAWTQPTSPGFFRDGLWTVALVSICGTAWVAYEVVTTVTLGGTLGKRAVGIHVCDKEGTRMGAGRAFGRSLARLLSTVPLGFGYLVSIWDAGRQTWHDSMAGTWVRSDSVELGDHMTQEYEPSQFEPRPYSPDDGDASEGTDSEVHAVQDTRAAEDFAMPSSSGSTAIGDENATVDDSAPATTPMESVAVASSGPGPVPASPTKPPPPPLSSQPRDPNIEAIARAGLAADTDSWLRQVAGQVDPRLDRVAPSWRQHEQSGAARACVFGLMLGRLANDYPQTSGDLGQVAEIHPSFATLPEGSRLSTLREIAQDKSRGAAWIAPLVGLNDPSPLQDILD